jgi:hypothetical protein
VNVRLHRGMMCALVCLSVMSATIFAFGQDLAKSADATQETTVLAKLAAREFLSRRGLLGRRSASRLVAARKSHAAILQSQHISAWQKVIARSEIGAAPSVVAAQTTSLNQAWQSVGPLQVSTVAYGNVTGRVSSIAADPGDASGNTVYLGTTGGGVWKSVNAAGSPAAVSFVPLTDNLPVFGDGSLASLSIGAVSVQPGNSGVVLAGTGDPSDALDSYYGSGLLRSTDGGLTWALIRKSNDFADTGLTDFYFTGEAFAGFAWSTHTPNLVVAAVTQSAEGMLVDAEDYGAASQFQPNVAGIYYSRDAGQTWYLASLSDGPLQVFRPQQCQSPGVEMPRRQLPGIRFAGVSMRRYDSMATTSRLMASPGRVSLISQVWGLPGSHVPRIPMVLALPRALSFAARSQFSQLLGISSLSRWMLTTWTRVFGRMFVLPLRAIAHRTPSPSAHNSLLPLLRTVRARYSRVTIVFGWQL